MENGEIAQQSAGRDGDPSTSNGTVKFSISKRKQVHRTITNPQNGDSSVEFVSSMDEIGVHVVGGESNTKLIPKLENTWKPEKRMKNLIPTPDDSKEFVSETLPAGPVEGVQYGLSVRSKSGKKKIDKNVAEHQQLRAKLEKQAFEEQLDTLPEQSSFADYESMPVEEFGKALLMGMGWKPGSGVGKGATEEVKPHEFVKRPALLGLGATPVPKQHVEKRYIRPGETREQKQDLVAPVGSDGKVRHRVPVGEKLVERSRRGVYNGKTMTIISGQHAGLRGEVTGLSKNEVADPGDIVSVKLIRSGETVRVDANQLAEMGSIEEENALKKLKELKIARQKEGTRPWLTSQIRVRIVSKSFKDGKYYLKKGIIIDVKTPTKCDVLLDEGDLVEDVREEHLETALPKKGGRIIVVGGDRKGSVGTLIERDNKQEIAVVQLEDDLEMVTLGLDYVTEYTG